MPSGLQSLLLHQSLESHILSYKLQELLLLRTKAPLSTVLDIHINTIYSIDIMPQRWICCRCDNGWTFQSSSDNVCGNSACQHSKCVGCELRSYAMSPFGGRPLLHINNCNHHHGHERTLDNDIILELLTSTSMNINNLVGDTADALQHQLSHPETHESQVLSSHSGNYHPSVRLQSHLHHLSVENADSVEP